MLAFKLNFFRPALLLLADHPEAITTLLFVSLFSMFPLSVEDGLVQLYPLFVVYYITLIVKLVSNNSLHSKLFHSFNIIITSGLVFAVLAMNPPERYPHLFTLLIAEYSFFIYLLVFLYIYYKHIESNWSTFGISSSKKKTS